MSYISINNTLALVTYILRNECKSVYVTLLVASTLGVLNYITMGIVEHALLLIALIPTSASIINTDKERIIQVFRFLIIIGASPQLIKYAIFLLSLMYSVIFAIPYVIINVSSFLTALIAVLVVYITLLSMYFRIAKRS